jgi:predicted Fe-Mo cluster-binding NifX family protein
MRKMRVAVPVLDGRVAPTFAWARTFMIADVADGAVKEIGQWLHDLEGDARTRVAGLMEQGVQAIVCGGISQPAAAVVETSGLKLFSGICGCTERVLEVLASDGRFNSEWFMPGWRMGRSPVRGRGQGCGRRRRGWTR